MLQNIVFIIINVVYYADKKLTTFSVLLCQWFINEIAKVRMLKNDKFVSQKLIYYFRY